MKGDEYFILHMLPANIIQAAFVTIWLGSCGAYSTSVINKPVAEVVGFLRRQDGAQLCFHLGGVLGAVGEA